MATAPSVFPRYTIEAHGSTSLVQVGSNYYLDSISSGTGPELQTWRRAGDRRPIWSWIAPIGAEQTASGYDVAWKNPGTDQYAVWSTDSNGNFISNITGLVAGNSIALESLETTFQQDLNGDGTIGIPSVTRSKRTARPAWSRSAATTISTASAAAPAPNCNTHGAPVTAGQFSALDADRRGTDRQWV